MLTHKMRPMLEECIAIYRAISGSDLGLGQGCLVHGCNNIIYISFISFHCLQSSKCTKIHKK